MADITAQVAADLKLTQDEIQQTSSSGTTTVLASKIQWSKGALKIAGLIEQPKWGQITLSEKGRKLLSSNVSDTAIRSLVLQTYKDHQTSAVESPQAAEPLGEINSQAASLTPGEQMAAADEVLKKALQESLLVRLIEGTPAFFETVIVKLVSAMGYGNGIENASKTLGKPHDNGIDGVIDEDRLGLDRVYLQAKKYALGSNIGSSTVQGFIGAITNHNASKGVLITTSDFTASAKQAAAKAGHIRIVLINGRDLAAWMIKLNVGVRVVTSYDIKAVDSAFFDGDSQG